MDAPLDYEAPRFIHPFGQYGPIWGAQGFASSMASAAWGTANLALYIPIVLPFRFNVRRVFVANGGTINGSLDIGIYSADGVRIYSSGSTGQSGASSIQYIIPSPDILLTPGEYYLALASSSATATFLMRGSSLALHRQLGMLEQTTAFALPSPATFAVLSVARAIPLIGLTSTDTGF